MEMGMGGVKLQVVKAAMVAPPQDTWKMKKAMMREEARLIFEVVYRLPGLAAWILIPAQPGYHPQ